MNTEEMMHYASQMPSIIAKRVPTVLGAILTIVIGFRLIKLLMKAVNRGFVSSKLDITVSKFLASLISIGLKILLFISVAGMFGVQTTSFVALLGAAGLAIGIALQGSLSNFAGGVLILLFKPYQIGDLVETQGEKGHVIEIGILNTTLTTLQNNTAVIPNGPIINDTILNLSTKDSIRVDVNVGVAYDTDIEYARKILAATLKQNMYILDNKTQGVYVNELGDSSVGLIVRGYASPESYRPAYFSLTEQTKNALDEAKISIPFPHMVVHSVKTDLEK